MTPSELEKCTLREAYLYTQAQAKKEYDSLLNDWKIARWSTAMLLNVHAKKGKKIKPTDILKLPDDDTKKPNVKPITKEVEELWEKWDKEELEKLKNQD